MAITIRLSRMGKKKSPFYRLVVADSRFPRDGRYMEVLGTYDPNMNPPAIRLHQDKIDYWLQKGANPSATVKSLLKKGKLPKGEGTPPPPATDKG